MRLTFVLPFLNRTGGVRLVLQLAEALQDAGHRVTVVHPGRPYRFHLARRAWRSEFRKARQAPAGVPWFPARVPVLRVLRIRNAFLPDADIVVATSWPTVSDVARLAPRKGRGVHLLMHHETGTGPEEKVAAAYRFPLRRVVLSEAVRREMEGEFGCSVDDVVPAGVDPAAFFPDGRPEPDTALMLVHPAPHKGAREGLAALAALSTRRPGLRVLLCGTVRPAGLPARFPFLLHPNDVTLRKLYSTAGVFLYPSLYEGFGLPPLEAMACGCPVVSTWVGAVPEYARDGFNAILAAPGNAEEMARGAAAVLDDPALRRKISANGLLTGGEWTIARAAKSFEAALQKAR